MKGQGLEAHLEDLTFVAVCDVVVFDTDNVLVRKEYTISLGGVSSVDSCSSLDFFIPESLAH